MLPLFAGSRTKLNRAKRHFQELDVEIKTFVQREPYRVAFYDDPESGDRFFKVTIREEIPIPISAIVGDFVHNLRAALDLAICDAVRFNAANVSTSNGFPIFDKRKDFKANCERKIEGTNARTRRLIHHLKPYKGGCKSLWALHNLDIVDKHNTLVLAAASYSHWTLIPRLPPEWEGEPITVPGINIKPADRLFPLQDGATILKIAAAARGDFHADNQFSFEICFGEGNALAGEPLVKLGDLGRMTERVVGLIERWNT